MMWAFEDMGMLRLVDAKSVEQYCRLSAETEDVAQQRSDAQESLKRIEENWPDYAELSPADKVSFFANIAMLHKLISKCTDQLRAGRMAIRQYLVEFGLTPASRGKVKLPAKTEAVDEFASYQRKRGAA